MLADFGWEYCAKCVGWLYFRKPAKDVECEGDGEIFSDNASRLEMVEHILRVRILPLLVIFLCVVIPNLIRSADSNAGSFLTGAFAALFIIYSFLLLYCGLKLKRIRKDLTQQ